MHADGMSQRAIGRQLRVSQPTVRRWIARGSTVDATMADLPSGRAWNRTDGSVEWLILQTREALKNSALGEIGAQAIHREFIDRGLEAPSVRTIGRVLSRSGALEGKRRIRRPAPPRGWYLPDLAARKVEMDTFDAVVGLIIRGGIDVEVLNGVSIHGGLITCWPEPSITTDVTLLRLLEHWRTFGLPAYAQFDNDTRFQGAHQFPDSMGRVVRLCLSLGVTPVFAPVMESGFQGAIESLNGRWQAKVWHRWQHTDLEELRARSKAYVAAAHQRHALRIESAPNRTPFPMEWKEKKRFPLTGRVVFLRRSDYAGRVSLLGRVFDLDPNRPNRLVKAVVHYDENRILFHALRRSDHASHPIMGEVAYAPRKE